MMPFYGDVEKFTLAVESVQRQTGAWRLVVIDDRYPSDQPRRFVEGLGDPRISYVLNPVNLGISGNFRRSVELATADLTTIMGCDDIMLPGYVDRMTELASQFPEAAYLQPGVATIDDSGARVRPLGDRVKDAARPRGSRPRLLHGQALATSLLRGNWTYFPSLCWRTEVVQRHQFREDFEIVLDLALQLSIIESGGGLVLDDEVVFEYRRHAASASSWAGSGAIRFAEEKRLFAETAARASALGWVRAARAARLHATSRLNAAAQLPAAVAARDGQGIRSLLAHIVSTGTSPAQA